MAMMPVHSLSAAVVGAGRVSMHLIPLTKAIFMAHHAPRPFSVRILRISALVTATAVFLCTTNPTKLPAMFLVVPFAAMYVSLYCIVLEVVRFAGADDESGAIVRLRRPRLASAIIAGFPILLLVLQSIVELTAWDVLIALGILLLGYLYVARGSVSFGKSR